MPSLTYLESVSNTSPNSAGFSVEGGRAVGIYLLEDASTDDLQEAITDILGDTNVDSTGASMNRTQPVAHPIFPWLYAESISSLIGIGPTGDNETAASELEAPTITTEYAAYTDWKITVEFKTRAYPVSADSAITTSPGTWYDVGSSSPISFTFPDEWNRYTTLECIPKDDNNIAAKNGQMAFRTAGGVPAGNPVTAMPAMFLPDMYLKVNWYQVPYRYVTSSNSYLTQFRGRINQNSVTIAGEEFPIGSLLYLHFSPKIFTSPVPHEYLWDAGIQTAGKLCNIEFTFLYTTRIGNNLPSAPANLNFVVAGHNLLPWLTDRQYYYCDTNPSTTGGGTLPPNTPAWLSAPLELLQSDPDA